MLGLYPTDPNLFLTSWDIQAYAIFNDHLPGNRRFC